MSKPTQTWFGWQEWILLISAIAITTGVVAILSPTFRNFIAGCTAANWAAAIGSLAAAFAAVWAATFAVRQQRLRERISAALSVRTLRPDIEHIKKELEGIRAGIQMAATAKSQADPKIESKRRLINDLEVRYAASKPCIDAAAADVKIDKKAIEDAKYRLEDQLLDVTNGLKIDEANSRVASTNFDRQVRSIAPVRDTLSKIDLAKIYAYSIPLGTQIELAMDDLRTCINSPFTFDNEGFLRERLTDSIKHLNLFLESLAGVTQFLDRQARADG